MNSQTLLTLNKLLSLLFIIVSTEDNQCFNCASWSSHQHILQYVSIATRILAAAKVNTGFPPSVMFSNASGFTLVKLSFWTVECTFLFIKLEPHSAVVSKLTFCLLLLCFKNSYLECPDVHS